MELKDIKKLAELARIDMTEEEMTSLSKDFDSILAYVDQVREASGLLTEEKENPRKEDSTLFNVMRDDVALNERGKYTEKIMQETPETKEGFLKVKKIL
jgi:aspartyl-tRNA(Asn)/glutamyl-tRNA(Gln) amidotransferase subunit C